MKKLSDLKVNQNMAFQYPVIKNKIYVKMLIIDSYSFLPGFKTEPVTELHKELLQMIKQCCFQVTLTHFIFLWQTKELKNIGISDYIFFPDRNCIFIYSLQQAFFIKR